jgi:protein LTV1
MQHLRAVGIQEEGVDSVLVEATSTSKTKEKYRANAKEPILLKDLPAEALPSILELPRNYESQEAVPASIAGFRPEMDPHLRQALEALEDDAFVDDDLEDDFFEELVNEGEREEDEEFEYEFEEDGVVEGQVKETSATGEEEEESWEARFAKFKKEQKAAPDSESDLNGNSEGGDTVGLLPKLPVIGGKRRRKGTSDASGYSMSSSSMFRTETLVTLDERFDQVSPTHAISAPRNVYPNFYLQVMEKEYAESDDGDDDDLSGDDSDSAPDLITTREDFEEMMDDFLDNYELLGRKMKPVLPGDSGLDKLNTLRRALGQDERVRIGSEEDGSDEEKILMPFEEDMKDRWDCETVLSKFWILFVVVWCSLCEATYSNLENHPRLIRARDNKPVPKITVDPRTGLPDVLGQPNAKLTKGRRPPVDSISEEDEDDQRELSVQPHFSVISNPYHQLCEQRSLAPATNQKRTRKLASNPSRQKGKPVGSIRRRRRSNSRPR